MDGLLVLVVLTAVIGAFDVLAYRFGADSRDVLIEAGRPARNVNVTLR